MTLSNSFSGWNGSSGDTDIAALLKKLLGQQVQPLNMSSADNNMLTPQAMNAAQNTPADNIAGALKSWAGYNYNSKGTDLGPQMTAANAMVDSSSPLFQKVYNQERGSAQQDLASAIAEASRQNNKLSMLGRTPLFSPERGGETQFRALTQGYQTAQDTARNRAREILGANLSAQNSFAQQRDANSKKKAFGFGNIADFLPLALKALG